MIKRKKMGKILIRRRENNLVVIPPSEKKCCCTSRDHNDGSKPNLRKKQNRKTF